MTTHAPNVAEKTAVKQMRQVAIFQDNPCGAGCSGHDSSDDRALTESSFSQSSACVVFSLSEHFRRPKLGILKIIVAKMVRVKEMNEAVNQLNIGGE